LQICSQRYYKVKKLLLVFLSHHHWRHRYMADCRGVLKRRLQNRVFVNCRSCAAGWGHSTPKPKLQWNHTYVLLPIPITYYLLFGGCQSTIGFSCTSLFSLETYIHHRKTYLRALSLIFRGISTAESIASPVRAKRALRLVLLSVTILSCLIL